MTATLTSIETSAINPLTRRYAERARDGHTFLLYSFTRPTDHEYRFCGDGYSHDEAVAWLAGTGLGDIHAVRNQPRRTSRDVRRTSSVELSANERAALKEHLQDINASGPLASAAAALIEQL